MKFKLLFLAVKLLVCVIVLLINVKMPTIYNCWHFNFFEDKFRAQLSLAQKKFYILWTRCVLGFTAYLYGQGTKNSSAQLS